MYSLTGVPPERQKIMVKGGLLKDDSQWEKLSLKPNQKLMMMGDSPATGRSTEHRSDQCNREVGVYVGI